MAIGQDLINLHRILVTQRIICNQVFSPMPDYVGKSPLDKAKKTLLLILKIQSHICQSWSLLWHLHNLDMIVISPRFLFERKRFDRHLAFRADRTDRTVCWWSSGSQFLSIPCSTADISPHVQLTDNCSFLSTGFERLPWFERSQALESFPLGVAPYFYPLLLCPEWFPSF